MSQLELAGSGLFKLYRGGWFSRSTDVVRAVDGVDLSVKQGETVALVGESGCGKSTLSRIMLGLDQPTAGSVSYGGKPVRAMSRKEFKEFRRAVQVIFQDPSSSLNPRRRVWQAIADYMAANRLLDGRNGREAAALQLERVGLTPASTYLDRYPSQLSGGQQQRVAIARAFSLNPKFITADEPLSSLDLSIQAQVLSLMESLQQETGVGYLLVTHDLNVVSVAAHRLAVMYLGRIVETGLVTDVLRDPRHPYTRALLEANLVPDPRRAKAATAVGLKGEVPSARAVPSGCRFHPRCPFAQPVCSQEDPEQLPDSRGNGARTACHFRDALPRFASREHAFEVSTKLAQTNRSDHR